MVNQGKSLNSVEVPVTKLGNKEETFLHNYPYGCNGIIPCKM